jgi:hypothetical protein
MTSRVLYVICCAAPPALNAEELVIRAQGRGWDVCLICTPTAARWLQAELPALANLTRHPVRSQYKLPDEPDALPPPDAILVAPATANTISKWALGISDTLALGLITEAIGLRLPLVALPSLSDAQAAHPAFGRNLEFLRSSGVTVLAAEPDPASAYASGWDLALDALDKNMSVRQS